jgi:tetratricopeptide (TPR) repeat protein
MEAIGLVLDEAERAIAARDLVGAAVAVSEALGELGSARVSGEGGDALAAVEVRAFALRDAVIAALKEREDRTSILNRGVLRTNAGAFEEAQRDFDAAVALDPAYAGSYAHRSALAIRRDDWQSAFEDAFTAWAIMPAGEAPPEKAQATLAMAEVGLGPQAQFRVLVHLVARAFPMAAAGAPSAALALLDAIEARLGVGGSLPDPLLAHLDFSRGAVWALAKDDARALEAWGRSLSRRRVPNVMRSKADALFRLGKAEEALALMDEAIAMDATRAELHARRGVFLGRLGRLELALEAFREARRLDPAHTETCLQEGVTLSQLGRDAEARELLADVVAREPSNANAWAWLGEARRKFGDLAGALEAIDAALCLAPDRADVHVDRARVLILRGERAAASEAVRAALRVDPSKRAAVAADADLAPLAECR